MKEPVRSGMAKWTALFAATTAAAADAPATAVTPAGTDTETAAAAWRKALERDWVKFSRQVGPMLSQTRDAESVWRLLAYIDEWRVYFEQYAVKAPELEQEGAVGFASRVAEIRAQLQRLTDSCWETFTHRFQSPAPAAPARAQPADPAAAIRATDEAIRKMREEEAEKSKAYWEEHNRQWAARFSSPAETDRMWRDIERMQRGTDKMWAETLLRARF